MRRSLAVIGALMLGAVVAIAAFAAYDPLFRRDLGQLPREFAKWSRETTRNVVRSVELAFRPDVIEPKRYRFNIWPSDYNLTLYRYTQSYPWITDGASLTFRFPRRYVLTNLVSGSGAVPEVPIIFDADTRRPPDCMPKCERNITVHVSRPYLLAIPKPKFSSEDFFSAPELPKSGLRRVALGNNIYSVKEEFCGFALYETNDERLDNLPPPFDRARIFRREAGAGQPARTVECAVGVTRGTCWTSEEYELRTSLRIYLPRAMLCEADDVARRARKILDDHLIKRTEPVPGWGRRVEK